MNRSRESRLCSLQARIKSSHRQLKQKNLQFETTRTYNYGSFPFTEFCDDSVQIKLNKPFISLMKLLKIHPDEYRYELLGYFEWRHLDRETSKCPVKKLYRPMIDHGSFHPYSSVKHKRRSASQAFERLLELSKKTNMDYVLFLDLTCPKNISKKLPNNQIEKKIRNAVKLFFDFLQDYKFPKRSSQFGVTYLKHLWSSMSPSEKHLHNHCFLPNIVYNKSNKKFHRFRPYFCKEELEKIRELWKKGLEKSGLSCEQLPDLYFQYLRVHQKAEVLHRIRYRCRRPLEDLNTNLTEKSLENADNNFLRELIEYTPRRVNLGFMTNLIRFGIYRNNSIKKRCPICTAKIVKVGYKLSNLPDLPHLIEEKYDKWKKIPPPPLK